MKLILRYYLWIFLWIVFLPLHGQTQEESVNEAVLPAAFVVRGTVVESESDKPIPKVNIEVNGGAYTTTNAFGEFRIKVRPNDELVIKHSDFETVYYTIKNNERITVKVYSNSRNVLSTSSRRNQDMKTFNALIDSANVYMKKDADKSLQFAREAFGVSNSVKQNAEVYETFADVNFEWKQYDLAATNYRISLQNFPTNEVRLKLGKSYQMNKNYQESIDVYNDISKSELSNWQLVSLYEGLGDVYFAIKEYTLAINNYKNGLQVAEDHLISPKITDLNSKIALTYDALGAINEAEDYFENSLNLAAQENKKRSAQEKVRVADFQNKNRAYEAEIKLREEALQDILDIEVDSVVDQESALTPQKQNYKIGNAYYLQRDFDNAIPYLERSIDEANIKEDLVVQKDATRKLSEVYRDAGNADKALEVYNEYIEVVDELYSKKEQEIIQAARFRQELSDNQSRISSLESDRALSTTKFELAQAQNRNQLVIIYSLIGGVILLLIAGYFMYKSIKQQKLANNLLALKSLRSQMNPHFIFNALNSVNSFIASSDERTANKYLTDFSLLMRTVLENSEEDFIPLAKEIELLDLYTKLEHFRFQDKFDYAININENVKVAEFKIPPMLLQPYIENAVWHGLRYKKDKGLLEININQNNPDEIQIEIVDNGIGRNKSKAMKTQNQKKHQSKGLSNIKKRVSILNEMYKDKVDVSIEDYLESEESGTKVVVTLKRD